MVTGGSTAEDRVQRELCESVRPNGNIRLEEEARASGAASSSSGTSLWSLHDSAVVASTSLRGGGPNRTANNIVLLGDYNTLPLVPRDTDPLEWWWQRKQEGIFHQFLPVVRKFLCVPATSVPSEQLFSKAGELISARRNRLSPSIVDMILFLNKNA